MLAVDWYRKAAEQGHAWSQFRLGLCYDKGQGVAKDKVRAVEWYQKAAEQGHVRAQEKLNAFHTEHEQKPENPQWALSWLEQSADQQAGVDEQEASSPI